MQDCSLFWRTNFIQRGSRNDVRLIVADNNRNRRLLTRQFRRHYECRPTRSSLPNQSMKTSSNTLSPNPTSSMPTSILGSLQIGLTHDTTTSQLSTMQKCNTRKILMVTLMDTLRRRLLSYTHKYRNVDLLPTQDSFRVLYPDSLLNY